MDVPLLCLCFQRPVDGLPLLHSWLANGKDIYHQGFENWREVLEVQRLHEKDGAECAPWPRVLPTKGLGRVSIILFAIYYMYSHKELLADDETRDHFIRQALIDKITDSSQLIYLASFKVGKYVCWGGSPNPRIHKNIVSKNQ